MDLLDQLKVDSFDLLGWSLGGGVALELASTLKTRVKHLILVASTTHKGYPIFKKMNKDNQFLVRCMKLKKL